MRIQFRLFLHFLVVLLVMLSNSVIANDDEVQLVDIQIPSLDDVNSEAEYLNPSQELTNRMIQWANTCTQHAINLQNEGWFLTAKKNAASTAAFGGWNWKSQLANLLTAAATKSYAGPLRDFINNELLTLSGKIDREQAYALACKAMNEHYRPQTHDAKVMAESMYAIASTIKGRYESQHSGSQLGALIPLPTIEIPEGEYPRWRCKGNGILAGAHSIVESLLTCLDTFDTPYKARDTHRILCGGEKDPNPSVAGCGLGWYTCKEGDGDKHAVKSCDNYIAYWRGGLSLSKRLGRCGAAYRGCPGSQSAKGMHNYEAVYSWNNRQKYASSYQAQSLGFGVPSPYSAHSGNLSSSSASFYGATKYSQTIDEMIDETASCSDCIDGSEHCPNASSHSGGGTAQNPQTPSTPSPGMASASGSYTVTPGSTHTATVTSDSAIYGVYLYVGDSSQWYGGSPSLTSLSMSYTFPSDASGDYTVSALVYAYNESGDSWGSTTTYSYTVTVGSGTTTTPSQVDNSPNCEYCTGSCSACTQPTTPSYHPCGFHETSVSGDHSLQASCTVTNGWFHSCTVTNFYACQTHTCVFPTFQCGRRVNGRRVCNESVSDEQEHYVICPNGHSHWSCKSEHYNHHRLRTCGNLYRSGGRCNKTWRRCDFAAEYISGTGQSIGSPLCPTDSNEIRRCAE